MAAFYKLTEDALLVAPNFVENMNYLLTKENKDSYTYPVDGWYWFESEQEARVFFDLPFPLVSEMSGMIDPYATHS